MKHLTIKTTNWEMTPEISAYLDERLLAIERLVADPDADSVKCDIELAHVGDKIGDKWRAEMNLFLGSQLLRVETRGESMQHAIDKMRDEMQRQLDRMKNKRASIFKRGGAQLKNLLKFGK